MSKPKGTILLINPYIEDFAAFDHFLKPLGLIWLAAYLKEHFNVIFVNALRRIHPNLQNIKWKEGGTGDFFKTVIEKPECLRDIPRYFRRYGLPEDVFIEELKAVGKVDYIFVTSGMTYWYTGLYYTVKILREIFPGVPIILGGIYAALLPEHAEEHIPVDFVISSQDINTCLDNIEKIIHISFSRDLKPPAYDLLGEYYYAPILTSLGCVFDCTYCASNYLSRFYQFPAALIADTILLLYKNHGVKDFAFYDDALLVNSEKHLNCILEKLVEQKMAVHFYTPNGLHVRYLTKETAVLMKRAGFVDVRLSLESCDENFLKSKGEKTGNKEFLEAIEMLYQAGFQQNNIRVYTLLNVPGQADTSVDKTLDFINQNGAIPVLAFYSPIPHTADFERASQITCVEEPLFQNNTVYLYRSGFDMEYFYYLKGKEQGYRNKGAFLKPLKNNEKRIGKNLTLDYNIVLRDYKNLG